MHRLTRNWPALLLAIMLTVMLFVLACGGAASPASTGMAGEQPSTTAAVSNTAKSDPTAEMSRQESISGGQPAPSAMREQAAATAMTEKPTPDNMAGMAQATEAPARPTATTMIEKSDPTEPPAQPAVAVTAVAATRVQPTEAPANPTAPPPQATAAPTEASPPTAAPTATPMTEPPTPTVAAQPTVAPVELPPVGTKVGDLSPDFTLKLLGGESVTSAQLRQSGQPAFLFFHATY